SLLQSKPLEIDVRFGSEADMCGATRNVRFAPESGHHNAVLRCRRNAEFGECSNFNCSFHWAGNGLINAFSVNAESCRPSRISVMIEGARRVRRNNRQA